MIRDTRPAPLNLSPPSRPRAEARRGSANDLRPPSQTYVPPNSAFDYDDDEEAGGRNARRTARSCCALARVFRVVLDFAHMITCMLPAFVMAFFLAQVPSALQSPTGPTAVVVIAVLGIDILLDLQSIGQFDKPWIGWCLILRTACGFGYLALFLTYVTSSGAFPANYTYWGLPASFASPFVYILLCVLLAWNMVHTVVYRRRLISEGKRYLDRIAGKASSPQLLGRLSRQRERRMQRERPESTVSEPQSVTEILQPGWEQSTDMLLKGRNKSGSVSTVGTTSTTATTATAETAGSSRSAWSDYTVASVTVPLPAYDAKEIDRRSNMRLPQRPKLTYSFHGGENEGGRAIAPGAPSMGRLPANTTSMISNQRPRASTTQMTGYDFSDARWNGMAFGVNPAARYEARERASAATLEVYDNVEIEGERISYPGTHGVGVAF